jgi:hypothetical protein
MQPKLNTTRSSWKLTYYKERQAKLERDYQKLYESLANGLGYVTAMKSDPKQEAEILLVMTDLLDMYSRSGHTEIQTTLRDMEQNGSKDSDDYKQLVAYADVLRNLDKRHEFQALQKSTKQILETYHFVQHCNVGLLQRQMDSVFTKYIGS